MKNLLQKLVKKIPLFVFCVLFIKIYIYFCGQANSTIGITLLTALLVMLNNDLGYKTSHASISIFVSLLLMVLAPYLSSFNPYLGFIINLVSILLILMITTYDVKQDNHVPFMLGYIFSESYYVSNGLLMNRIMSVVIIGLVISVIYYLKNKDHQYDKDIKDVFIENLQINSHTKWYLQLTITLSLVMFVGSITNYPTTIWICFVILSLIRMNRSEAKQRMKHRIPATIIGSILCFVLINYVIPPQFSNIVALTTGFTMMFITSYHRKTMANSFSAMLSAMVIYSSTTAVFLRIISNTLGVFIAIMSLLITDRLFDNA